MKTLVALLCALVFGGSVSAQSQPASQPAAPAAPAAPATPTAKPEGKKSDPKKEDARKKEDKKKEEPKIEGITIRRANGTFLGLKLEGGTFKLSFYDAKKKPAAPDVTRAAARWNPKYKQGSERIILNLGADGKSLVGRKPVRPPYVFKLYLTLLQGGTQADDEGAEGEQAVESFVVDFRV